MRVRVRARMRVRVRVGARARVRFSIRVRLRLRVRVRVSEGLVVVVRVRVRTDRLQPQRMMHHAHRLREGRRALLRHSAVLCGTVPRRALLCAAFTTALITAVPRRALGVGELVVLEQ